MFILFQQPEKNQCVYAYYVKYGTISFEFLTIVILFSASFRLVKPLMGPAEHRVMLRLEHRSYVGNRLLSAHNTHLFIDVSALDEGS